MKKRVAVFASGWNSENTYRFVSGLKEGAPDNSVDFFLFLCNATYTATPQEIASIGTIFELADVSFFDAFVFYQPGQYYDESVAKTTKEATEKGKVVVHIGEHHEGVYSIGINNYVGMEKLCEHLIQKHDVKSVCFIAGSREHPDSNVRMQALKDSFSRHGLVFEEEDVFYSQWDSLLAVGYIEDLVKTPEKLPDAFVCANDYLAEAVTIALSDHGIKTPQDVIVTGFDGVREGQVFYPSITTVDHCIEKLGNVTTDLLVRLFRGEIMPMKTMVNCQFQVAESCGCREEKDNHIRRKYVRNFPKNKMIEEIIDVRRQILEETIISATGYENLKERIRKEFEEKSGYEGDEVYCMIDPVLGDFAEKDISELPINTFCDEMDIMVGKRGGVPIATRKMKTAELIPEYTGDGENKLYVIMPIRHATFVCGYLVFVNNTDWIMSKDYCKFEQSINRSIILYKRNIQVMQLNENLKILMEKDALTNAKNRIAYERYIGDMETAFEKGELTEFAVVNFDVNNLKIINDSYGHEQGDVYLKKCCRLICETYKHSPVFRVGGDEFVTILVENEYGNRKTYLERMHKQMKENIEKSEEQIKQISIAIGMAEYDEHIDHDVKSVLSRADELMYENKMVMKKGNVR